MNIEVRGRREIMGGSAPGTMLNVPPQRGGGRGSETMEVEVMILL